MRVGIFLTVIALLSAWSQQQAGPGSAALPSQQPAGKYDPATAATITGVVHFAGTAPQPKLIDMSEDSACKGQNQGESLVVHGGRLANVVVYVKDGLPKGGMIAVLRSWSTGAGSPPDPLSGNIQQKGCRYEPHVSAVLIGQKVTIYNDDPTTHNVHPMPHANKEWNASQSPGAEPIVKTFSQPELMIPVKCNVHPWMKAYVNVMSNPFYAVTDKDGSFTITGLPPGTYTIAAVHERLGEETAQVTVGPKAKQTADFTFKEARNTASLAR